MWGRHVFDTLSFQNVGIRVRIGHQYPLFVPQDDKDPSLLKSHNRSAKAYILQPFPANMVTYSYKGKNFEWNVKQHTTNLPPIKLTLGWDISMFYMAADVYF